MTVALTSIRHQLASGTPLCPRTICCRQNNPKDYLCDLPEEIRLRHLGETPCSVCSGCVPRDRDPEGVIDALCKEHAKGNSLRTFYGTT